MPAAGAFASVDRRGHRRWPVLVCCHFPLLNSRVDERPCLLLGSQKQLALALPGMSQESHPGSDEEAIVFCVYRDDGTAEGEGVWASAIKMAYRPSPEKRVLRPSPGVRTSGPS